MRFTHYRSAVFSIAALTASFAAFAPVARAQTLSGAIVFGTELEGFPTGDIWNTLGNDDFFNLWVSLEGTELNGPGEANAAISTSLAAPGTYNFTIFGNPGGNAEFHGMNLFFDGNNTNPTISVFAPTATSAATPAFTSNAGVDTLALDATLVSGAGDLSFVSGGNTVTLTAFRWEDSTFQNEDLVSSNVRAPGGGADNQGSFTLVVAAAAPEPATLALLTAGSLPLLGLLRRRKR